MPAYSLVAPDRLVCADRVTDVGATVYRALSLLASKEGAVTVREMCLDVWNVDDTARRSVHSLCHRVNEKLAAVGCALRCTVDGLEMRLY